MPNPSTEGAIYAAFWLYKLDPAFTRLPLEEQEERKAQFLRALYGREESVTLRATYSLVGLREEADLMLWVLGPDLDAIRRLAVALRQSGLGRYLAQAYTYIGVTTKPRYDPDHQPAFAAGAPPKRFASVYPFVKTTDWYLLSREERGRLMTEHGRVGKRYAVPRAKLVPVSTPEGEGEGGVATAVRAQPETAAGEGGGVLSNTVDAFGLGDYEFILANESDDPAELNAMMMALRATEVRRYTKQDVPIFLGRLLDPTEALAEL